LNLLPLRNYKIFCYINTQICPVKNFGPCFIFRVFSINVVYSRNLQPRITEVTRIALGHSVNVAYSRRFYRQYGDMTEIFGENFLQGCILFCTVLLENTLKGILFLLKWVSTQFICDKPVFIVK
jgi:hypothetical protein